ncbi:MAG: hypothetical protein HQL51_08935 [Magnetococcales bacterium]|nr:hypothetical protein [Magnetococcales bacterium]
MNALLTWFTQPGPPLSGMPFTRFPVVHRFWGTGLLALLLGFGLGIVMWIARDGGWGHQLPFDLLREHHAQLQAVYFTGTFILGFALQAGPHVIGAQPLPTARLLWLPPLLWAGFLLSTTPWPILPLLGNALSSAAFLLAGWGLLTQARTSPPERRWFIGYPLAAGVAFFAVGPWLPLEQPAIALAFLLSGPVAVVLAVGQHLIANILGGQRLDPQQRGVFVGMLGGGLLSAWVSAAGWWTWEGTGAIWLALAGFTAWGTKLYPAMRRTIQDPAALAVGLAMAALLAALLWLALGGISAVDGVVHWIGIDCLTLVILAVAARVSSFFTGAYALSHPLLRGVLLLTFAAGAWRGLASTGLLPLALTPWVGGILAALLLIWAWGVGGRLLAIGAKAKASGVKP